MVTVTNLLHIGNRFPISGERPGLNLQPVCKVAALAKMLTESDLPESSNAWTMCARTSLNVRGFGERENPSN